MVNNVQSRKSKVANTGEPMSEEQTIHANRNRA
jgi:hypothetical protein